MDTPATPIDLTRKYVRDLRDFYMHVAIWLVVSVMLFVIDSLTPGGPWFYWPVLMWGVAVAINAVSLFLSARVLGAEWENRKVRELQDRAHTSRA